MRAFFAAHPHCGIPAAGNPSHRKGPAERAAQYGAGMQRSTALVCSAVGYIAGFLWSLLAPCSWLVHILFLSYVISIAGLLLLNVGLGFHASGHACSTTAPALLLTWKLHPLFIIPSVLLIVAVYRSSLKLSRHTLPQLLAGSAVSLLACGISTLFYGTG